MIYLNGEEVNVTLFPDNTSQVWKLSEKQLHPQNSKYKIVWKFQHEGEISHLAQLSDLIYKTCSHAFVSLHMPYLPYGRQDKLIANDATFALRSFKHLISGLGFAEVTTLDAHSNTFGKLFTWAKDIKPLKEIYMTIGRCTPDLLVYPDGGAAKRYTEFIDYPSLCATKKRDQQTGQILEIKCDGNVQGKKVLIVDDICDGGGTFCGLAEKLYNKQAEEVHLYVTHGIFSKGLKPLKEAGIKNIYTKDGEVSEIQGHIATFNLNEAPKEL